MHLLLTRSTEYSPAQKLTNKIGTFFSPKEFKQTSHREKRLIKKNIIPKMVTFSIV